MTPHYLAGLLVCSPIGFAWFSRTVVGSTEAAVPTTFNSHQGAVLRTLLFILCFHSWVYFTIQLLGAVRNGWHFPRQETEFLFQISKLELSHSCPMRSVFSPMPCDPHHHHPWPENTHPSTASPWPVLLCETPFHQSVFPRWLEWRDNYEIKRLWMK